MQDSGNKIINVILPRRLWESYDYALPIGMEVPAIGSRVRVPLRNAVAIGIVIGCRDQSKFTLKNIIKVIDEKPLVSEEIVDLGKWLSSYYHHPLGSVFETLLPRMMLSGKPARPDFERQWQAVKPSEEPNIRANAHRQIKAWEAVKQHGKLRESMLGELDIQRNTLEKLEQSNVLYCSELKPKLVFAPVTLTPTDEQQVAIDQINQSIGQFKTFLLDGITGSGKTEVYLRVIENVLKKGEQVLVMVPEIAITPQMTQRFEERFGWVGILHSMIPNGLRFQTWARAASGELPIVVGTRSAIFTPFKKLGLIVVDEEHDSSYKQAESLRYSARDIAVYRANKLNIPCVLGSATPSLESIVNVRNGRYSYLRLSRRPGLARIPSFYIQDMRHTDVKGGICEPLIQRIREHLKREGQVLVLINRRGFSTQYFCKSCGWIATCDDCDVKLTWHQYPASILQCHSCGKRYQPNPVCPDCGKEEILMLGVGTQQVEDVLAEEFPDVPHKRIDRDSVRTNRQLTETFNELQNTHEGLLVGTQMLAKGHHFPNVTLVAVIAADHGFLSADFHGAERTAQLIVQVAGRAGRAEKQGEVWIQTYMPENPDLVSLVERGYEGFAETELIVRQQGGFPPFGHIAVIRAEGPDETRSEDFCHEVLNKLRERTEVSVLGPVSAPIARVAKQYRFQGIAIAKDRPSLHRALTSIERMSPTSRNVRWSIDVDPIEMA